ncbi:hypothetical protein BaRGS_00004640, partial [Batillaria attramentaria]
RHITARHQPAHHSPSLADMLPLFHGRRTRLELRQRHASFGHATWTPQRSSMDIHRWRP